MDSSAGEPIAATMVKRDETKRREEALRKARSVPPLLQYTAYVLQLKQDVIESLKMDRNDHELLSAIADAKEMLRSAKSKSDDARKNTEETSLDGSDDEDDDEDDESFSPEAIAEIEARIADLQKQYENLPKSIEETRQRDSAKRQRSKLAFLLSAAGDGEPGAQLNLGKCYLTTDSGVEQDFDEALRLIRAAAEQGYVPAYYELGLRYSYGEGVERDDAAAVDWFSKAAEGGFSPGEYSLGVCHLHGKGTDLDVERGVQLLRSSADKGFVAAMCVLAQLYEEGGLMPKDMGAAIRYYKRAGDMDTADALCSLRRIFERTSHDVEADEAAAFSFGLRAAQLGCRESQLQTSVFLKNEFGVERGLYDDATRHRAAAVWCGRAAAQNYAPAQSVLGWCYHDGDGVVQSHAEAAKWWRQAADNPEAPNLVAMYMLGVCLENGQGVERDTAEAFAYFKRAAEAGDGAAQQKLGWCLEFGHGCGSPDMEGATRWYATAAKQGQREAQNKMALFYEQGIRDADGRVILQKSHETAVQYLQQAADSGHATAQGNLGLLYERGAGVERSDSKAMKYLQLSADQGNDQALCNLAVLYRRVADSGDDAEMAYELARCYAHGRGVPQDEAMAIHWYKRAAMHGSVMAKYDLALCLEGGVGTERDLRLAAEWYREAAEDGDENARNGLPLCYKQLADDGDCESMCFMGMCYENAIGLEMDFDEAAEWYRRAAEKGYKKASLRLAALHRRRRTYADPANDAVPATTSDSPRMISPSSPSTRAIGFVGDEGGGEEGGDPRFEEHPSTIEEAASMRTGLASPATRPPPETYVSGGEWKPGKIRENLTLMHRPEGDDGGATASGDGGRSSDLPDGNRPTLEQPHNMEVLRT